MVWGAVVGVGALRMWGRWLEHLVDLERWKGCRVGVVRVEVGMEVKLLGGLRGLRIVGMEVLCGGESIGFERHQ